MNKSQNKLTKQKKAALLTFINLIVCAWVFVVIISPLIQEYSELNKHKNKYDTLVIPIQEDKKESQP